MVKQMPVDKAPLMLSPRLPSIGILHHLQKSRGEEFFCYLLGCHKRRDSLIEIKYKHLAVTMTTCTKASFLLCSPKPDNGGNKVMKLAYKEIPYEYGPQRKK